MENVEKVEPTKSVDDMVKDEIGRAHV